MSTLANRIAARNTAQASPYIDTVELFFSPLRHEARHQVAQYGRIELCWNRNGQIVGYRLYNNQPSRALLRQLYYLARKYRGVLHRFDIALDSRPTPGLRDQIVSTAMLKWCKAKTYDIGGTVYWARKRSARNLVLYDDRRNRMTGAQGCIHLELRFIGAAIIRRQGIHSPLDLLTLNPKQLFDKHVKWTDAGQRFAKNAMRRASDDQRKRYAGRKQLRPSTDRNMAFFIRNVSYLLHRLRLDRAQNVRNTAGKRLDSPIPIPTEWVG